MICDPKVNSSLFRNYWILTALLLVSIIFTVSTAPAFAGEPRTIYINHSGTPVAIRNFISPESGCNWSGVGGQVFNQQGVPISGLIVKIGGKIEDKKIEFYTVTGSSPKLGPGGFVIEIQDRIFSSENTLHLKLLDASGAVLSEKIPFSTYEDCKNNLVIINLVERFISEDHFLPFIVR